jgi:hypothetical protein
LKFPFIRSETDWELQIDKRHWKKRVLLAPSCFPKFAQEGAAKAHELRKGAQGEGGLVRTNRPGGGGADL